jgi:hypothetical protein
MSFIISASPIIVEDEDGNCKTESVDNLFGDLDINVFPRYYIVD